MVIYQSIHVRPYMKPEEALCHSCEYRIFFNYEKW